MIFGLPVRTSEVIKKTLKVPDHYQVRYSFDRVIGLTGLSITTLLLRFLLVYSSPKVTFWTDRSKKSGIMM